MVLGVALGGVVAIVVELLVLLAGAAAISSGLLRENAQLQLVAMACVLGGLVGGLVCACRWPARKLLGGLAAGLTCGVLLWIISAARGGGQVLEVRGLVVLTSCLCGGALAGFRQRPAQPHVKAWRIWQREPFPSAKTLDIWGETLYNS